MLVAIAEVPLIVLAIYTPVAMYGKGLAGIVTIYITSSIKFGYKRQKEKKWQIV
jgi:hypothetical protein